MRPHKHFFRLKRVPAIWPLSWSTRYEFTCVKCDHFCNVDKRSFWGLV